MLTIEQIISEIKVDLAGDDREHICAFKAGSR